MAALVKKILAVPFLVIGLAGWLVGCIGLWLWDGSEF